LSMQKRIFPRMTQLVIAISLVLSACAQIPVSTSEPAPAATLEPTSTQETPTALANATPTSTPTSAPVTLWVNPALPEDFKKPLLEQSRYPILTDPESADLLVLVGDAEGKPLGEWVYALVAPFDTVQDEASADDLLSFWQQGSPFGAKELVMGEGTYTLLKELLGQPVGMVRSLHDEELLSACWATKGTWAIIPFGAIEPKWKVIALDGQSPLHKDFNASAYALSVPFGLTTRSGSEVAEADAAYLSGLVPEGNRDATKLATVILTGVTALVRATAKEMELYGITRPGEVIAPVLREADITHISNEIPFAKDCPPPRWVQEEGLVFCSDDRYIALLEEVGTDVIELTGDHFQDWGAEATLHTLDMYDEEGWPYYGGGRNIEEAKAPLKLDVNGNKIAFLGCNAKAAGYATASETNPGAYHCDMDYMTQTVRELVSEGYLPIVTFQHEEFYRWEPVEEMISDFQRMAEAGAVVVSGSQAHQPHRMEFFGNSVLRYGLGNLFFDQKGWYPDSDKAFIDRHVFYDGKYLGVELLTVQFFDYSQPVWMTPEARASLLNQLFSSSGWEQ